MGYSLFSRDVAGRIRSRHMHWCCEFVCPEHRPCCSDQYSDIPDTIGCWSISSGNQRRRSLRRLYIIVDKFDCSKHQRPRAGIFGKDWLLDVGAHEDSDVLCARALNQQSQPQKGLLLNGSAAVPCVGLCGTSNRKNPRLLGLLLRKQAGLQVMRASVTRYHGEKAGPISLARGALISVPGSAVMPAVLASRMAELLAAW